MSVLKVKFCNYCFIILFGHIIVNKQNAEVLY